VVERSAGAAEVVAAVFQPDEIDGEAIAESLQAISDAAANGVQLLTLPELFWLEEGVSAEPSQDAVVSSDWLAQVQTRLAGGALYVATSLIEAKGDAWQHIGVLVGPEGVVLRQPQLHMCARHETWMVPGDSVEVAQLPWGRVAVLTGDDNLFPETYRLAVLKGAEVIAAPFTVAETWEVETGLLERAAENRVCLVAASRPSAAGASLLCSLVGDYTLMTPWAERAFDGDISKPIVQRAARSSGVFTATLHPAHTANKVLSHRTHVVDDRAWSLAAPLLAAVEK